MSLELFKLSKYSRHPVRCKGSGRPESWIVGGREIAVIMGMRRIAVGMAAGVLFASAAFAIPPRRSGGRPRAGRPPGQSAGRVQIGQEATDFELPVLIERQDDKGQKVAVVTTDKVKLSSYRGKRIVCVFMSSYT